MPVLQDRAEGDPVGPGLRGRAPARLQGHLPPGAGAPAHHSEGPLRKPRGPDHGDRHRRGQDPPGGRAPRG